MSGFKMKCFNRTCKCGNIELERVLKIRCRNCHCSIIYDIEQVEPSEYGECNECGRELDEDGFCSYPCPNCD